MAGRAVPQEVKIQRVPWSQTVKAHLSTLRECDPTISLHFFATQVEAGAMELIGVFADDKHVGSILCRIGQGDLGREMVVIAAGGQLPGVDLTASVLPALECLALDARCTTARVHAGRPGMAYKLARQGYVLSELVLRKRLVAHA